MLSVDPRSVCTFRGPPGLATPFVRRECTETAHQRTRVLEHVRGAAAAATQAAPRDPCHDLPLSGTPLRLRSLTYANLHRPLQVTGAATGCTSPAFPAMMAQSRSRGLRSLGLEHRAMTHEPNCSNCLRTVWQCGQFPEGSRERSQCQFLQNRCFAYDVPRANGSLVPVAVRDTPACQRAARAALRKCAVHCGDCIATRAADRNDARQGLQNRISKALYGQSSTMPVLH